MLVKTPQLLVLLVVLKSSDVMSLTLTKKDKCFNKMAANSIDDITRRLAQTKVVSHFELSFKGKGLKLDKAEDGIFCIIILFISYLCF